MPNLKINNKTYSGVTEVHIPLADGSGNEDFAYINSDTKRITTNGTHDVKHYGTVNVAVPTESDVELQTKSVTPSETAQTVTPDSGYDGLSSVSVGAISKTYVGTGVTKKDAQTYTPGTSNQTIASGQYLNGTQTILGDADLVAGNIRKGVNIFNVTGTYEGSGGNTADPVLQEKIVSPTTSQQTVTPDSGYDGLSQVTVNAMPTATQATPSITVSANGLITASATQTAGYVEAGTKSVTNQLATKAAQTYTPTTSNQTIASKRYLTGVQTIKGDTNLIASNIKSGVSIFNVLGTFAGESGGGGGGLPDGISALATGTVYYTTTSYAPSIEHGLGVVPNFFFVIAEGATSISGFNGRMVANFSVKQTLETYAGYYATLVMSSGGSVTNNTQPIAAESINDYFNAQTFKPYGFFQTNKTYRWYAGVLNMIS